MKQAVKTAKAEVKRKKQSISESKEGKEKEVDGEEKDKDTTEGDETDKDKEDKGNDVCILSNHFEKLFQRNVKKVLYKSAKTIFQILYLVLCSGLDLWVYSAFVILKDAM